MESAVAVHTKGQGAAVAVVMLDEVVDCGDEVFDV